MHHSGRNLQVTGALLLVLLLGLSLSACAPSAGEAAASNGLPATVAPLLTATATMDFATIAPPVTALTLTVPTPTAEPAQMPAFSLVDVPPSATPLPTATAPSQGTGSTQQLAAATETPSPTPPPTFTPPALPFTSLNEHYWLRRPIAEGGTVWTDKSYPYGSTRGGKLRPHHGVEFYVGHGTEVLATASGTVVVAGTDEEIVYGPHNNFYGNLVVIELDTPFLDQPVFTLYAHLSEIFVAPGQHVDAQEVIALSGATGVADGPHLHFEVRVGENDYGYTRNPLLWLYPYPEHGTVAGTVAWPSGELVHEAQVFLRRIDAPSKYAETSTYANAAGELNADEGWGENFAFDDVEAGYYEVEVRRGQREVTEEVWVYERRTSFVEIVLDW